VIEHIPIIVLLKIMLFTSISIQGFKIFETQQNKVTCQNCFFESFVLIKYKNFRVDY
jgi:hypothetical protein